MPTYTFECPHCEEVTDVVRPMSKATEPQECPSCGKAMVRSFRPCEITPETYRYGQRMSAYPPVNGKTGDPPDVIQSRGEKKRWLKEQNKAHGYSLVYD